MPFRFRLEKVMRHRKHVVDARSRDVAEAGREVRLRRERAEALQADIVRLQEEGVAAAGGRLRPAELQGRTDWLRHLRDVLDGVRDELAAAERVLDERRAALTLAWRDLEVLHRLEERQREAWADEQRRRDSRDMDEVGQIRAERARREKVAR